MPVFPGCFPQMKVRLAKVRLPGGCVQLQCCKMFFVLERGKGGREEKERGNNQCFLNFLCHELPCLGWHVLMFPISIPRVGMLENRGPSVHPPLMAFNI